MLGQKKQQTNETEELYQGYQKEKFKLVEPVDEGAAWDEDENEEPAQRKRGLLYVAAGFGVGILCAILLIGTNSNVKKIVFGDRYQVVDGRASGQQAGTDTTSSAGSGMIATSDPNSGIRTDVVQGRQTVGAEGAAISSSEELAELIDQQIRESVQASIAESGLNGLDGSAGNDGATGSAGMQGTVGPQGEKGEKGETGATGAQGEKGEKGETGATGAQGEKGEKGETGATGAQGERGEKGETGAAGKDGKSVYQLAVEGGYTGTEEELMDILSSLGVDMEDLKENMDQLNSNLKDLEESFRDGCSEIEKALKDKGVNPKSNSPEDLAAAISEVELTFKSKDVTTNSSGDDLSSITFATGITGKTLNQSLFVTIKKFQLHTDRNAGSFAVSYNRDNGIVTLSGPGMDASYWADTSVKNWTITIYYMD